MAWGLIKPWLALTALIAVACGLSALIDGGYGNAMAFAVNLAPLVVGGSLAAYLAILILASGITTALRWALVSVLKGH